MPIIATINYKGGVGKTTLTANLAAELALRGSHVLVVDLDPQASLTFSIISVEEWRSSYEQHATIKNWYDALLTRDQSLDFSRLVVHPQKMNRLISHGGRVDLVCSHLGLINIDLRLASHLVIEEVKYRLRVGQASSQATGPNPHLPRTTGPINPNLVVLARLAQGLAGLDQEHYHFVLIDCPPNFNLVTKNAIVASDYLLIPARPDYLSTLGIDQIRHHVAELVREYNGYVAETAGRWKPIRPELLGVVFTMAKIQQQAPVSVQQQYIDHVRDRSIPVMETFIRTSDTVYAEAAEKAIPAVLGRATSKTQREVQDEWKNLTTEILEMMT
ncbi:MAG: ParA family protein [Chloroflexaceae bacterium]|nr:ParA family protein [Chloroflexaceae bacterium]